MPFNRLAGEARLLSLLRGHFTTSNLCIRWQVAELGFDGYEKLRGRRMPFQQLRKLGQCQQRQFGEAIGQFLAELHATSAAASQNPYPDGSAPMRSCTRSTAS